MTFSSWGNYPRHAQSGSHLLNRHCQPEPGSYLPYGLGRSYGDSCQHHLGQVVSSALLNQLISFDESTGVLCCEAGVRLADIVRIFVPRGWFLPVTPGTQFVTVAGAIANDVHGKNHVLAGSFGCYVQSFELLRSNGERLFCSQQENSEYFYATIGGLGLTGFISYASIQLKAIASAYVESETIKYQHLDDFFALSQASENSHEYTAAWLDCLASGEQLGRGHFIRGNHASDGNLQLQNKPFKLSVPLTPPISLINRLSLKAFNLAYYHRQRVERQSSKSYFEPFFYPLDSVLHWNRIYGRRGFVQYQCVIPTACAKEGIRQLLQTISQAGEGSFLVVLKMMGKRHSGGVLSFPQEGATLAMDFPFRGQKTLSLLERLDAMLLEMGGRLYIAKDARMSAATFQRSYPQWPALEALRDKAIMSDFWRRVRP